jgi:hypothetical protein
MCRIDVGVKIANPFAENHIMKIVIILFSDASVSHW